MDSKPVNLQELKPEGFKAFLNSFDHVFSDCCGDSGYPLRPWLMTPYLEATAESAEATFNEKHIVARVLIENTFGRLKNRWRCLCKDRVLHYKPQKCALIIQACCVLYNIALDYGVPEPDDFGVIWAKDIIPGAGKFFSLMKNHGKTVSFVSNNSCLSKENYEGRFKAAGIENGVEHLTTPSVAIAEYLKSVNFNKKVYSISCPETNNVLKSYGFEIKEGPDVGADYYEGYVEYTRDDPEIGAVVMDCGFKVNLPNINKAITYLGRPEVLFLRGATDKHAYFKPGARSLATGVFSELVAEETNRAFVTLGKPGKPLGEFVMKRAGVTDPSRVLFIGDMIEQDVGFGRATGFKTLLVLTNTSKDTMLAHKTIRPDFYADSLGSIVPLFDK